MANPIELLPLLIVALVLIGASGADVASIEIAVDGDRTVTAVDEVLIVGGGTVTVPDGERVNGSVYVIGGDAVIRGTIDGDVVQLAGTLTVADTAAVTGELQTIAGEQAIGDGASIGRRTDVPTAVTVRQRSPVEAVVYLLVQALVLALAGWWIARRNPVLLRNVGDSVTEHGLVSGTVGLLASATGLALIVFMAITVLLLPISVLGLLLGVVVVEYSYVVFGYLIGRRLPIEPVGRATAVGVVAFVVLVEVLGRIPVVGALAQLGLILMGIGAVLITYFGLREFQPVELPG